ncbi:MULTISPECIES: acyltransferase family protein [Pseudomonas]|uniref:acyltransferase family protein n=1 Tax=Pseudomonas TaxID=286 RepID=UPI000913B4B6|nr:MULTISPECIES: acyltransferase family protein [Pseudomonas]RRW50036.1 acyltransferase [Pseudomonas luteola]SHJ00734.1 Peptidoglycan/LPS O-acetylase OafA/YrhL, contains acyltransferase and SGNH-hydrolase domains [Pseudomonas zeshuii]
MERDYRSDIDGLRAIAVLLVLLNHVGVSGFGGGFIGVDVFFVISGFLITQNIAAQAERSSFSFTRFYLNRIKRLMPALTVVIFCTSIAAFFVLLPNDLIGFSRSALFSYFGLSNFYFWKDTDGYFSSSSHEVPLLHTWSLAVEEQYYFVWPLLFLLGYRLLGKRLFNWAILAVLVVAIVISELGALYKPLSAYYLLPTRAFELLIGSALAMHWRTLGSPGKHLSTLAGLAGLALILIPALVLDKASPFPGLNALWPCLGAALLIWSGGHHRTVASQLLSLRPLVFIGLISYSLYLWHWPLIAFHNYVHGKITATDQIMLVSISLALAYLSWRFVEQPFRTQIKFKPQNTFAFLYLLPVLMTTSFLVVAAKLEGFASRYDSTLLTMDKNVKEVFPKLRAGCFNGADLLNPLSADQCKLGVQDKKEVDVLLVGDSHAGAITGMIDVMLKEANLRGYDITRSNTIYLPDVAGVHVNPRRNHVDKSIELTSPVISNLIEKSQFKYVILSGRWAMYLYGLNEPGMTDFYRIRPDAPSDDFIAMNTLQTGLQNAVAKIVASGATPVIIEDVPEMGEDLHRCDIKKLAFELDGDCSIPVVAVNERQKDFDTIIDNLNKVHPGIVVIDPKRVICDTERCYSSLENVPLYMDGDHLNTVGSSLIGRKYITAYGNLFKVPQGLLQTSNAASSQSSTVIR